MNIMYMHVKIALCMWRNGHLEGIFSVIFSSLAYSCCPYLDYSCSLRIVPSDVTIIHHL